MLEKGPEQRHTARRRARRSVVAALAALGLTGCGVGDGDQIVSGPMPAPTASTAPAPPPTTEATTTTPTHRSATPPLTLYVSNQSLDDPTVAITVLLDGRVVLDDSFDVGQQHNWKRIDLDPGPGPHHLRAVSDTDVVFETTIDIEAGGSLWAVLDYWWSPPRKDFTFTAQDEPLVLG